MFYGKAVFSLLFFVVLFVGGFSASSIEAEIKEFFEQELQKSSQVPEKELKPWLWNPLEESFLVSEEPFLSNHKTRKAPHQSFSGGFAFAWMLPGSFSGGIKGYHLALELGGMLGDYVALGVKFGHDGILELPNECIPLYVWYICEERPVYNRYDIFGGLYLKYFPILNDVLREYAYGTLLSIGLHFSPLLSFHRQEPMTLGFITGFSFTGAILLLEYHIALPYLSLTTERRWTLDHRINIGYTWQVVPPLFNSKKT